MVRQWLGKLFRTRDCGGTWIKVWDRPGAFIRIIDFLDSQTGFLGKVAVNDYPEVTDPAPLYRTRDGGESWTTASALGLEKVAGLCAIDTLPVTGLYWG